MVITKEWLESGMKGGIGIKRDQCKVLGLPYPPSKGWKKTLIGMNITDEQAKAFLGLKDKRHLSRTQKVILFDKDEYAEFDEIQFAKRAPSCDKNERIKFTHKFIKNFLKPDFNYCTGKTIKARILKISRDSSMCDREMLFAEIKKMPYSLFLTTPYWKTIAENQKRYAGKRCALCGSDKYLNLHHSTYKNHGDEIFHLSELVTVCRDCHRTIHGLNNKNPAAKKESLKAVVQTQIKQEAVQLDYLYTNNSLERIKNISFDDMRPVSI